MTAPPMPAPTIPFRRTFGAADHQTTLKVHKTINGMPGRWTITDSHLSPDNERSAEIELITVAMSLTFFTTGSSTRPWSVCILTSSNACVDELNQTPTVYLATTRDASTAQHAIQLADSRRGQSLWGYEESFGIYSCRFSADGNEVIAGGSGRIFGMSRLKLWFTVDFQLTL